MTTTRDGIKAPKASRHARLLRWFLALASEAHRDEDGGSMVFGAITIFLLSLLSWLIYIVGMTSSDRMQIQGAADAAAYSGALVEAESLESIAFLNDGMAFVYYAGCRYAIDATVYGTLAVLYNHDYYQYSKETSDGGGGGVSDPTGPQTNLELAGGGMSGAYLSNPGARDGGSANYLAPPPAQQGTQLTLPYLWALLGGPVKQADGDNSQVQTMFDNRLKTSLNRAMELLAGETPYAKLWVSDIHSAERIILAATPFLIRRTCIDVALRNRISDDTTTCVAVSDDTDKAWTVATSSNGDLAGFSDEQQSSSADKGRAGIPLADRYAGQPNPVDQTTIGYPIWFDETTGRMKVDVSDDGPFSGYSQTRTCWNKRDWQHETDENGNPRLTEVDGQPAGHWHVRHAHQMDPLNIQTGTFDPPPVPALGGDGNHDFGHGREGGLDNDYHVKMDPAAGGNPIRTDFDWDQSENSGQDDPHMLQVCVTCEGNKDDGGTPKVTHTGNGAVNWYYPTYWGVSKADAAAMLRFNFPQTGGKTGVLNHAPSMLRARGPLFRAGVTVAVWTRTASLGETLRQVAGGQDFGMLAIASAMVGPRTADTTGQSTGNIAIATQIDDSKVTFTSGGNVSSFSVVGGTNTSTTNLFLGEGEASQSNPGVRWGARLVPVARDFTWVDKTKTASQSLAAFLNGNSWYVNDPKPGDAGQGATAVAGVDFLGAMAKFYDLSKANSADWINH